MLPARTTPRTWIDVCNTTDMRSVFNPYSSILTAINLTASDAYNRMCQNYEDAITNYTASYITEIFIYNLKANAKKYAELVSLYSRDIDIFSPVHIEETYTDTRTPDLTSESSSSGTGTSDSKINQSKTSTVTPATTTTNVHSVNPYDDTGFKSENQDVSSESGTHTTVDTYSGQPDHTATATSAESTVTTTGTETIEHELTRSGRDGRFTVSEIIEQAETAAAKLGILDIIINDLADQIFLQVWA